MNDRELGARADAVFGVDARERVGDGLLAEKESGRDLLVGVASGDEFGDLALTVGEFVVLQRAGRGKASVRGGVEGAYVLARLSPVVQSRTLTVYVRRRV